MSKRRANKKLFKRYLRYLVNLTRYQKVSTFCNGGSWYISADEVERVYKEDTEIGLSPLIQATNIEDIGEFFADLVVYKGVTYRIESEFHLHLS